MLCYIYINKYIYVQICMGCVARRILYESMHQLTMSRNQRWGAQPWRMLCVRQLCVTWRNLHESIHPLTMSINQRWTAGTAVMHVTCKAFVPYTDQGGEASGAKQQISEYKKTSTWSFRSQPWCMGRNRVSFQIPWCSRTTRMNSHLWGWLKPGHSNK